MSRPATEAPGDAPGEAPRPAGRERTPASSWARRAVPYALSIAAVALASLAAVIADRNGFGQLEFPLILFAVASTVWYPGVGPAVLSVVLATLSFNYYFIEPRYTLWIGRQDLPYFATFVVFSSMLTGFSVVRRSSERALLESRERLRVEVAERKAREEQIEGLNAQLEARSTALESLNGELEAFAYSVSHDLRAPLRHMVGFAELLQQSAGAALDDKSRRYLATVLEAAARMGHLIDDLLAFSRVGRAETQTTTVSLVHLVKEVIEELRPEIASRNVTWIVGDLPVLHGDPSMLKQVLVNLVANALKFTRPRERSEIEVGSFHDRQRGVVVFVKDNGVGFDMRYYRKLFGVFQRLHRTEDFEGTGIGLATVKRIVERHGGTVWAQGAVNGGATFFFSVSSEKP